MQPVCARYAISFYAKIDLISIGLVMTYEWSDFLGAGGRWFRRKASCGKSSHPDSAILRAVYIKVAHWLKTAIMVTALKKE
jgi:hypothetical protein